MTDSKPSTWSAEPISNEGATDRIAGSEDLTHTRVVDDFIDQRVHL